MKATADKGRAAPHFSQFVLISRAMVLEPYLGLACDDGWLGM